MQGPKTQWIAAMAAGLLLACPGCKGDDGDGAGDGSEPTTEGTGDTEETATPAETPTPADGQESAQAFSEALHKALENIPDESRELVVPGGIKAEDGAVPYEANCSSCHGNGGGGDGAAASFLNPGPGDWTTGDRFGKTRVGEKFYLVTHGVGGGSAMPGYEAAMSDKQIWAIIAHLQTLGPVAPAPEPAPAP